MKAALRDRLQSLPVQVALIITGTLAALFVSPLFAPLVLLAIFLKLAALLPFRKIGAITRLIIVALLIASVNTVIGFIAWAAKLPIQLEALLAIYAAGTIIFMIICRDQASLPRVRFERREIFAAVVAFALFWVIISPLPAQPNAMTAARVIAMGGDNISHIEFIRVVGANKGYVQDDYTELKDVLTAKLIPYPQGWHLNVSFVNRAAETLLGPLTIEQFLYIYHLASAAGISLLLYIFMLYSLTLMESKHGTNTVADYLSTTLFAAILFCGPYFTFMTFGFQTQIAALMFFLAELLVLTQMARTTDSKLQKKCALIAVVLCVGIAYIWLFLLPVALAAAAIYTIDIQKLTVKKIRKEWLFILTSWTVAALALGQVLMQMLFSHAPNINEPGYILETNNLLLLSLLLIIYVFLVFAYKNQRLRLLGQVTGVSAIFSLLVFAYQLFMVSEPRYFYYKSTWTFVLLACLILAVATSLVLSSVVQSIAEIKRNQYILTFALVLAFFSAAYTSTPKQFRLYLSQKPYGLSEELADGVINIVRIDPRNAHKTVAIGSCNREDDIKAMRFTVALGGYPDFAHQDIIETQVTSAKRIKTFESIKEQLDTEDNLFVLSSDYILHTKLLEYLGDDAWKVTVLELDRGKVEKSVDRCPHYLR